MSPLENENEKISETSSGTMVVAVVRVVIGADSAIARGTLSSILRKNPALQIIGSFSVAKALAQLEDLQPDVALLDLGSPADESISMALESRGEPLSSIGIIFIDDM